MPDAEDEAAALREKLKTMNILMKQQQIHIVEKNSQLVDLEKELTTKDLALSKLHTQIDQLRGKTVAPDMSGLLPSEGQGRSRLQTSRPRSRTAQRWRNLFLPGEDSTNEP